MDICDIIGEKNTCSQQTFVFMMFFWLDPSQGNDLFLDIPGQVPPVKSVEKCAQNESLGAEWPGGLTAGKL